MGTRFVFHGDREKAEGMIPEGARQMFILKNAMRFQGLKQLKRIAILSDGSRIVCSSVFGIDNILIEAHSSDVKKPVVKKAYFCWCNSCFAEGVVKEIIGDYEVFGPWFKSIPGDVGKYKFYPLYCQYNNDMKMESYIRRYEGIRYRVSVCQGESGHEQEFICIPSDFAGYQVGDEVIVLFMGLWPNKFSKDHPAPFDQNQGSPAYLEDFLECQCSEDALCEACMANHRIDQAETEADGSFIIIPMRVEGINADN